MMARTSLFLSIACALVLGGCIKGPNYSRPKVDVPAAYRGQDNAAAAASTESLGNAKWWTVFEDQELQKLIRVALAENFDVRIAATRVLQATESVEIAHSNQYPTLLGGIIIAGQRAPGMGSGGAATSYNIPELGVSGSWDVDFWGKYRRLTEAARAELMATEWGRRAVVESLVSGVAAAYFDLRELDMELEISRRTLASREDSLQLTRTLVDGGAAPLSDQRQAEQLVETAAAAIPDLERAIAQQENAINILLGRNPGIAIARGLSLSDQPIPQVPPAGIPSALLARRPDIGQAEQNLIAANAQIGVARAAFFPEISLTAIGGIASGALTTLFRGASRAWNYTASVMEPIFTKGRLDANLRLVEAQHEQALLQYQQAIQQSFRDVSDALIAYQKLHEFRAHREKLLDAARDASQLSRMRYQGGATSYLEVLTNETNYFSAELGAAGALLRERLALVQLYTALGGGWEQ